MQNFTLLKLIMRPSGWKLILIIGGILFCLAKCSQKENAPNGNQPVLQNVPEHPIPFHPRHYICKRTPSSLSIDGKPDDIAWQNAPWTDEFVDIEGELRDQPTYRTRVKMLWDDRYFYFLAKMEEPHIWAKLKQRDTVIFYDNDFEIFIDPDQDTHMYAEFEMNALNTVWDLLLVKPYRDGGPPLTNWNMPGLKSGVNIQGTLNNPQDTDEYWTVEVAIPWTALDQIAPGIPPEDKDQWWVNFSRVQWHTVIKNNGYRKEKDQSGETLPEQNWVWSPQGYVDMHRPYTWGIVQFASEQAGNGDVAFIEKEEYKIKWYLRNLYLRQRQFHRENGFYAGHLKQLQPASLPEKPVNTTPEIKNGRSWYVIELNIPGKGKWLIREDGKTWFEGE